MGQATVSQLESWFCPTPSTGLFSCQIVASPSMTGLQQGERAAVRPAQGQTGSTDMLDSTLPA